MREVDLVPLFNVSLARKSAQTRRIIVDSASACIAEAGELYHLRQCSKQYYSFKEGHSLVELGSLLDEQGHAQKDGFSDRVDDVTVL